MYVPVPLCGLMKESYGSAVVTNEETIEPVYEERVSFDTGELSNQAVTYGFFPVDTAFTFEISEVCTGWCGAWRP